MQKKKADKPASGKADKLKALKSKKPVPVKAPLGGPLPKKKRKKDKTIEDHIEEATGERPSENGHEKKAKEKKLTTDELREKLDRTLIIYYLSIEKEHNFLVMSADEKNKKLPVKMEGDTFQAPVHKKFIATLQKLRAHAGLLTDYFKASHYNKVSDIPAELLESINVTSVHLKYPSKGDSIQINATITTERKTAFNFTTPVQSLRNSDADNAYPFAEELLKIRQILFDRVDNYMSGEERGEINDVGLFAEAEESEGTGEEMTEAKIASDGKEHDVTNLYGGKKDFEE